MTRQAKAAGDDAVPPAERGEASRALLGRVRYLTPGESSEDGRVVVRESDGRSEEFYRDRWRHDREVRSTHGVNCTGSCSWMIYVRDGIVSWETQATDYPETSPDMPDVEPRGCPRGATFSWYTYQPGRVRYPYVRGALLEMWREARREHADPVDAWASIATDPAKSAAYKDARGHGGFMRATWDEALELCAAAHVDTIERWGPDRVASVSPIPAMSPVSHASGSRYVALTGGAQNSFYDWYADLPPASPQTLGRPDRRARVRGLVARLLPHDLGQQRAGHAHARRPLHGRGALRRSEGRRRLPRLRRARQVRRRLAAGDGGHGRGPRARHGPRRLQGVLRRPRGAVLHALREDLHGHALPGHAARARGRLHARPLPDRLRPRRAGRGGGVEDRGHGRGDRPAGGAQRVAGLPLVGVG